jgi:hypothetical protein
MFSAITGRGAMCNGKPIKASKNVTGTLMTTNLLAIEHAFQQTP